MAKLDYLASEAKPQFYLSTSNIRLRPKHADDYSCSKCIR